MKVQKPEKTLHFPSLEKDILQKWESENTFQESVESRSAQNKYNFYDGPPFATGLPHFGHFVPSSIKDAFPRYFTMKGYRVARRFGWDCHGVPVELLVQKELGLNGKIDIEKFGISKFNEACRKSVMRYTKEWREYMRRLGRWVDMENEYRTMDMPFMESVWAVVKNLWTQGLIYQGKFVVSYSSALGTTLSNFEASLDYRDVQDPSVTVKCKLKGKHAGKSLLVWTTTPWTLPVNIAVAVHPTEIYAHLQDTKTQDEYYILKSRIRSYWKEETSYVILNEFAGSELEGSEYEPLFSHFTSQTNENCFKVYSADYVLSDAGTGAVHTAPAFGEDDFQLAKKVGLPLIDHLDSNGKYLEGNLPEVVGLSFKEGDKLIMADLKKRHFVFLHETLMHSYPHCYRSGSPLMYRAVPSWFVKVADNRDRFKKVNEEINWVPEHIKTGRFGKWIANARDWNIARSRYWGNPIPIWKNETTGEEICIGSVEELQKHTEKPVTDLHMEFIDHIQIPSQKHPGTFLTRVPFVLDCWFESGSMPYAQSHYPFEHKDDFESLFPADFVCEGLDQTRGWFYTMTMLAALMFDKPAFKNVVVNGLVLAEDGRKMSKSLKNYPDPMLTLDEFGADAVRLFLLSSPATTGEEVRFSLEGVRESTRRLLLPFWNAYSFFATYASLDGFDPEEALKNEDNVVSNELDKWILLRLNEATQCIDHEMTSYQIAKAVPVLIELLDDLNNWYIRRSRRRFWNGEGAAYSTLFKVLVSISKLLAPYAPFAAEYFFQQCALTSELKNAKSVHLTMMDSYRDLTQGEAQLVKNVSLVRRVVELGRNIRVAHKIKNRQPLSKITIAVLNPEFKEQILSLKDVICEELNVKDVVVTTKPEALAHIMIKPNFKVLGKTLGDKIKVLQETLKTLSEDQKLKALQKHTIHVNNFELSSEQLIVELRPSGEELVATTPDFVASLDPTITAELKMEGVARELVSLIQRARKAADFNVEDRIELSLKTTENLSQAILEHKEYIEDETLSLLVSEVAQEEYSTEVLCEGETVTLSCKRHKV